MSKTDWIIFAAFVLLEFLCSLEWANDAHAAEPQRVSAEMVCAVQDAIRWREPAWTPSYCATVAAALSGTTHPVRMLAIAINESDLRARAIRVSRLGVYDIGLMAVRCVTVVGAHARADWRSVSVAVSTMETQTPRDRCTNGAARGLYAHQLLDTAVNIRTAAAVLASHRGELHGYAGATTKRKAERYRQRIEAIEAALRGEVPRAPDERTRKLCRQISEAHGKESRS